MGEEMRIYVGGLGSSVEEPDLKKTFTSPQLGTVQSVEIIRTKGRSFAYLEFVPASERGLAKLFSTYNGCLWRGGRLKLEKAKDDYIVRLKREWEEDSQVEMKLASQNVDEDESAAAMQKPKKDQDIDKLQIKIYFPKLRKIKPVPLKGTGKHKYSFQRVEVPPLPIHFCDCEEHCGPPEPAKRNYSDNHETDNCGVNEDELNMMKSILNKLLEKGTRSVTVSNQAEITKEKNHDASLANESQVDDNSEDQVSDDDNLVINMVGQPSKRVTSFEDWGLITTTTNQDSLARQPESLSNSMLEMHGTRKGKHILDKKRKQSIPEDKSNEKAPAKKKGKIGGRDDSTDDIVIVNTQPIDKEPVPSCGVKKSNKPAWKSLVSEKAHTAFNISNILPGHNSDGETKPKSDNLETAPCSNENDGHCAFNISDILPDRNSEGETKPKSDHLESAPCSNENDGHQEHSSKHEESEKLYDVQSTKTSSFEYKLARGAAWLKKSSWLQMVSDANTSTFNLAQILPEATLLKQERQEFSNIDFSNLSAKEPRFVHKDQESPVEDVGEPHGRANKDIYATPRNTKVDMLNKEQNYCAVEGGQSNSDSKGTVKEESSSALMLGANMVPNYRPVGDIVISETCPFMRSAASMKEWVKSKAALSGSHKKKGEGKGVGQ